MVNDCKVLMHMPWTCRVEYVQWEVNCVAISLAKMGHHTRERKIMYSKPPVEVDACLVFYSFSKKKREKEKSRLHIIWFK